MLATSPYRVTETELTAVGSSIVNTLLYFDIFRYPLTGHELWLLNDCSQATPEDVHEQAILLVRNGYIYEREGFYFVNADDLIVQERRNKNALAQKYHGAAGFFSRLIGAFPFTKAVFLSGSLSKNCMDAASDIDYFIITKPGRLWLNRMLLILFKKIALLNSHKFFCVNYFIDNDNLEIPDKNIYTAIEIAFLVPTYNDALYHAFMAKNYWVTEYLPHFPLRPTTDTLPARSGLLKTSVEHFLEGSVGDWLDDYCFRVTVNRWKKKFPHLSDDEFELALRSKKDVSKHHPNNFQHRVLQAITQQRAAFEVKHNVRLH